MDEVRVERETVALPNDRRSIQVTSLCTFNSKVGRYCDALRYLHRKEEDRRSLYEANLPRFVALTASLAPSLAPKLILSPPSDDALAEPFRTAIVQTHEDIFDLSPYIGRDDPSVKSRDGTSVEALARNLCLVGDLPENILASPQKLLIVDESFSTGKTAAALDVFLTETLGLKLAEIAAFAPLRIIPTKLSQPE